MAENLKERRPRGERGVWRVGHHRNRNRNRNRNSGFPTIKIKIRTRPFAARFEVKNN
jgi:hypothetical protein